MNWSVSGASGAAPTRPSDTILTADGAQAPMAASTDKTSPAYGLPQAAPYFAYTYPGLGEGYWSTTPNFTSVKGDPNAVIDPTKEVNDHSNKSRAQFRY